MLRPVEARMMRIAGRKDEMPASPDSHVAHISPAPLHPVHVHLSLAFFLNAGTELTDGWNATSHSCLSSLSTLICQLDVLRQ